MKTLQQVKDTVNQGLDVYWKNPGYKVVKQPWDEYLIIFTPNGHCVGLNNDFCAQDFFTLGE